MRIDEIPPALQRHLTRDARLTYPAQGMTSEVAVIDGAVIKHCRDPLYLEWLAREHDALRALEGSGLPIPHVVAYEQPWLIMTRLDGRSLWTEMLEGNRADLLGRLGQLLRRLHSTPVPQALKSEESWLDRQLVKAQENLSWCDGTRELLADLHRRRPPAVAEVLIHGDLALDNVLVAPDGEMSLIDWSNGDCGDPRHDVSLAVQTEPEMTLSDREVTAFFAGYGTPPLDRATRKWFEDLYEFF